MQRYYVKKEQVNNNTIVILGDDVHHIKDVMRMNVNDEVICVVNDFKTYKCIISYIDKSRVETAILEELEEYNEINGNITIAQGVVRREKTEEVLRRITELGASSYLRVKMARSVVKANDDKMDRLNTIVKEASEQSHRSKLLTVSKVLEFNELLSKTKEYDYCFYADCNAHSKTIYDLHEDYKAKSILILIGPEGGFDDSEKDKLEKSGFVALSFGNRILRTETAPLYAVSLFSYFMGEDNED